MLGDAWKVKTEGEQRKVMGALDEADGPMGPKDVAAATGKTEPAVKAVLYALVNKDLVVKEAR